MENVTLQKTLEDEEKLRLLIALAFSHCTDSPYLRGRRVVPPSVEFELYWEAPGRLPPLCYWLRSAQRESPPGRGFSNASPACQQTNNRVVCYVQLAH